MNLSSLKTFAPEVRRQLIEAVGRKLDFVLTGDTADLRAMPEQRKSLGQQAERDRKGLVERVAYTWFNRFAALRFLDARGWHPFTSRVLTPATGEETQPELLKLTRNGSLSAELTAFTDLARLNKLLDGHLPSPDPQGEVYRHLVLAACRFYHSLLPHLFEALDDETELLLPDDLLTAHSVAHGFRTEITDEDCASVEILGWLYQFYISERKDQVMARKSAVPTEDIPAVTQLFTPHWIVRYLVENSLGRLWLLNRPGSRLREHMPYYIEGENSAPGGSPAETDFLKITKPEEIRLCDPAVGSGHMLTYAFDLLTFIYEEEGYAPTEIPALILRHNLHGLEICPRAAQLAELALVFKARHASRRFFQPEHLVRPHIIELRDVRFAENELRDYIRALGLGDLFNQPMLKLLHQFEEAKNFGSLIQPCLDERAIADIRRAIEAKDLGGQLFLRETHLKVLRVLEQAEALTQRYHVVVANPPYMGSKQYNGRLKTFVEELYEPAKPDLYACFVLRALNLVAINGLAALITIPNWMFIARFKTFREDLLRHNSISSMIHLGRGLWGADYGSCSFVIRKQIATSASGIFRKLFDKPGQVNDEKTLQANFRNTRDYPIYRISSEELLAVTGSPIAFWVSRSMRRLFGEGVRILEDVAPVRQGFQTGENDRFIRLWFEVDCERIEFQASTKEDVFQSGKKWVPYNKGGVFRKWFGNNEFIVAFDEENYAILAKSGNCLPSRHLYFKPSLTWSAVSISAFSARVSPKGFTFSSVGACAFPSEADQMYCLGLLNSSVAKKLFEFLAATIHFNVGSIRELPLPIDTEGGSGEEIPDTVTDCVAVAHGDWDGFETSWNFRDPPLLRPGLKGATLEASWRDWEAQSTAAIRRMQELETENNRLFIAAYGLEGELQPEVPEAQITLARAEAHRDMAAFLSYAVGCMMGRYSPDHPGLLLANAGDSLREFLEKVGKPLEALTFAPDEDGIIPVLDGEWFEDDIVARTRDFLRATFGEATLEANLSFLEQSLGKSLRKYFLTDFYKDHLQTYKKRPIYWMFSSAKKGFNVLIYLHRYTRDTANRVLNRYLRDFLPKLRGRLEHLDHVLASESTSAREKTVARKEGDQLRKTLRECEDYERDILLPLAQQRIELDLDDGVKANYLKLGLALTAIAGLAAKEED